GFEEAIAEQGEESRLACHVDADRRALFDKVGVETAAMFDTVAERVARATADYFLEGFQHCADGTISLGVDADLESGVIEFPNQLDQLRLLEEQHTFAKRRHRVFVVDVRGAAAHPAVRVDVDSIEI